MKNGDRQYRPRADEAGSIGSVRHPAWDGEASPHFSTGGRGRFNRRAGGLGRFEVQFEGFPEILDRFFFRGAPGWQCRFPGTGTRTNYPHARQSRQMVASWLYCFTRRLGFGRSEREKRTIRLDDYVLDWFSQAGR